MRILVISHSCVIDVNQHLYQELASRPDVELMLIAPDGWKSEYTHQPFKTAVLPGQNFSFYKMPVFFAGNNSLHFYRWLPFKQIRRFKPDLIFLHQEPWSLVMAQILLVNLVWLRQKIVFLTAQNILKNYPPPFSWIRWWTLKTARQAIVLSDEGEQVLQSKGFKRRITLLPHTINEQLFYPQQKPVGLKNELGLGDAFVIGYVGRLVEEKGVQVLLEAARQMAQEPGLPDWKILLVGSGDYQPELEKLTAEYKLEDRVKFAGTAPHIRIPDYMNCLDLFVLPSLTKPNWKEQFGRVIIEALACGVPLVGSDSGEIPHLIELTGGGLVSREGDADSLKEEIKKLLCDPGLYARLARQGRDTVLATYTDAAVAAKMDGLFREEMADKL